MTSNANVQCAMKINKSIPLILLGIVLSGLPAIAADRPNILWLSAEDINGDPHAITPHLDGLAKTGVRYTNALLRMNTDEPAALAELEKSLRSPEQWSRLHAAIALDEAGEQARPAIAALKESLKNQPNKYITRVANKALNDLLGTQNSVD